MLRSFRTTDENSSQINCCSSNFITFNRVEPNENDSLFARFNHGHQQHIIYYHLIFTTQL